MLPESSSYWIGKRGSAIPMRVSARLTCAVEARFSAMVALCASLALVTRSTAPS